VRAVPARDSRRLVVDGSRDVQMIGAADAEDPQTRTRCGCARIGMLVAWTLVALGCRGGAPVRATEQVREPAQAGDSIRPMPSDCGVRSLHS